MTRATDGANQYPAVPASGHRNPWIVPLLAGSGTGVAIFALFALTGAFSEQGAMFNNPREQLGHALLLILLPAFFVGALPFFYVRSRQHLAHLAGSRGLHPNALLLLVGAGLGLVYALAFNVHPDNVVGYGGIAARWQGPDWRKRWDVGAGWGHHFLAAADCAGF